jgi:hypothetical protein
MRSRSAVLIGLTMQLVAPEQPPQILQIYREALKPCQEAAWAAIEEQKTNICLELKCPHPYLGIESLSGRQEARFLNGSSEGSGLWQFRAVCCELRNMARDDGAR